LAASDRKAEEIVLGLNLAALRELEGKRQEDLPGFSQENVSRLERRADSKISTCVRYVESLDYELVLIAVPKDPNKRPVVLGGEASAKALRSRISLRYLSGRTESPLVGLVAERRAPALPTVRKRNNAK
jgi:hypothetical protein